MPASPVIVPEGEAWVAQARGLAARLALTCAEHPPAHGLWLGLGARGLALHDADAPREKPLYVDFAAGALGFRQRAGFRRDELLPRAAGLKGASRPSILDATAGLGRDAFMLASLGCEVVLCERHPVVLALLEDGLRRARLDPILAPILGRMHLRAGEAASLLDAEARLTFDVIVLDPMFPEREKSAQIKKPMRLFHALVGEDRDAKTLLEEAIVRARRRVVVKRPRHAEPLGGLPPSLSLEGRAVRFDIYLTG